MEPTLIKMKKQQQATYFIGLFAQKMEGMLLSLMQDQPASPHVDNSQTLKVNSMHSLKLFFCNFMNR